MKTILFVCLVLSVALAHDKSSKSHDKSKSDSDIERETKSQDTCVYSVGPYEYNFSRAKGRVFHHTTQGENGKNITWSWSLCGPMNDSACGSNSAFCIADESTVPEASYTSYGNTSVAIAGDDDSITLSLTGDQECTPGQKKTATIKLICSKKKKHGRVVSAERDACTASLTIASRLACAVDEEDEEHVGVFIPVMLALPCVLCCAAVVVSCICVRRRMMRKRAGFTKLPQQEDACCSTQMKQMVPQVIPQQMIPQPMPLPQQPIRLMVPMPGQQPFPQQQPFPGYYPMYPVVQMPTAPVPTPSIVPPAPREAQMDVDEKVARDLQAQFDKEAQV